MTDPWKYMRDKPPQATAEDMYMDLLGVLDDADALLAVAKVAGWAAAILGLTADKYVEHDLIMRQLDKALDNLPEHLR